MYIIPNILRQALKESRFDYSKVTRGFIETQIDYKGHTEMQVPKNLRL